MYYLSFLALATISLWMISCKDEKELTMRGQRFITIEDVRTMYQGEPVTIRGEENDDDLFIGGIVISNADQGNNPEGKIIIQNEANGRLRGIALAVEDYITRYKAGDSVIVKINGKILEKEDGFLQISGLSPLEVGRISVNNDQRVHVETEEIGVILADKDSYESTLVQVRSVDLVGAVRGQTYGDGDITLSDGHNIIAVKTRETATYASSEVLKSGNFRGIFLQTHTQEPYLSIRSSADYDGVQFPPVNYDGFPEGFEIVPPLPSGEWELISASRNAGATVHLKRGAAALITQGGAGTESIIAMDFDLLFGASQFSLYYGQATTSNNDSNGSLVYVEYSQDEGTSWTLLEPSSVKYTTDLVDESAWTPVTPSVSDPAALIVEAISGGTGAIGRQRRYFAAYDDLGIEGSVRFRVRKPTGTDSRIMVDDIFVKPNTD